jgi:hypothetical protein
MPRAEIASKQALFTLAKLHSEVAGKLIDSKAESRRFDGLYDASRGGHEDAGAWLQRGHHRGTAQEA